MAAALRRIGWAGLALGWSLAAGAAELIYVWEEGCPYCRRFDERIAPLYGRTEEGRRLPLRRVEKSRIDAALPVARPVRYTPTFILVDGAREIGRIEGYPGEEFFFPMLQRLIERLPPVERAAPAATAR